MTATVDFPPPKRKSELNLAHFKENCHRYHDLICDFHGERPEIVVLCGSTKFFQEYAEANYTLTMANYIVLSVGFYPHATDKTGHGEGIGHDSEAKVILDELHKRKIDLADRVVVLNIGGYIGSSTQSEIEYAEKHGKPVHYHEAIE
jgi:hypothetical protein